MRRICAWCGKDLGDTPVPPAPDCPSDVSHGICPECRDQLVADSLVRYQKEGKMMATVTGEKETKP